GAGSELAAAVARFAARLSPARSARRNPWRSFRGRVLRRAIRASRGDWAAEGNATSTTFRTMDFAVGRGSAELNRHPHVRPKAGGFDRQSFGLPRRYSDCDFVGRQGAISHHFGCQEPVGGRKASGAVCRTRLALPPQLKSFQTQHELASKTAPVASTRPSTVAAVKTAGPRGRLRKPGPKKN